MTPPLPEVFLRLPIAHRALHDLADRRPENGRGAIAAAVAQGYGIEIDLQPSADGQALVFHDYDMMRLTGLAGPVHGLTVDRAAEVPLSGGDGETIPTLPEVLALVAGQVPLLIELKDQDGAMGPGGGDALERAAVAALNGYDGPVALMSFNPHVVARLADLAPHLPRGLVTSGYDPSDWPLPVETCAHLRAIPDFDRVRAGFISHEASDLARPRVAELKSRGVPVLCWTIRSPAQEAQARRVADNITFENYLPPLAG
ncbi:Glycerophosphoryl diester phosphodiesterase [Cribrihabitans marinus]|uniref:Glycerophosphoryl diester phosphodiesterase n=1 Tax=Cribrihabitans marinus TaxID=1227549 RepID=A0A1H7BUE5_9RHOB|nr:glycerophosphodiester phosphodiesterase family protein [Cribrihabitans marinus]GGH33562.1 phosphodiesterase [Cribrihabitans marinus]SEJ81293.1 Glycerophosphoryl diester phosphodiesterase [Cribrihabitans marinus]